MSDEIKHLRRREAELLKTTNRYLMRARAAEANLTAYREALQSTEAWLDRWAVHVGDCKDSHCTCGLTAVNNEAQLVLLRGGQ